MPCGISTIYLSGLPPGNARAALPRYTRPCNPGGLPQTDVTIGARELLPHVFTLGLAAGSFLWHFLPGYPGLCFQSLALCVVRTFLQHRNASGGTRNRNEVTPRRGYFGQP